VKSLTKRLITEKYNRPLIANIPDEKLSDFIGKHLFERSAFYTQAELTIEVSSMQIDQIVQEVYSALN
jgi:shikimate kinase